MDHEGNTCDECTENSFCGSAPPPSPSNTAFSWWLNRANLPRSPVPRDWRRNLHILHIRSWLPSWSVWSGQRQVHAIWERHKSSFLRERTNYSQEYQVGHNTLFHFDYSFFVINRNQSTSVLCLVLFFFSSFFLFRVLSCLPYCSPFWKIQPRHLLS